MLYHHGKDILFRGDVVNVADCMTHALLSWTGGVDFDRDLYIKGIKKISLLHPDIVLADHH